MCSSEFAFTLFYSFTGSLSIRCFAGVCILVLLINYLFLGFSRVTFIVAVLSRLYQKVYCSLFYCDQCTCFQLSSAHLVLFNCGVVCPLHFEICMRTRRLFNCNTPLAPTAALFSMLLFCSRLAETISVEFHRGGTKPEVVFRSGSRCCRRVFQVALDRPRLAQSSETSSTAPEYYFRFAAATLDFRLNRLAEPPRVSISCGTPPAHWQLPRNRWRTLRSSALKRGRNGLFLLHPTFHSALSSYTTSVLDASRLFRASAVDFRRIPPWRHKPEVVFWSGSRCCRRVFQVALDHLSLAQSSETSSTAPEYYFRFAAATLDFRPSRLAKPPRVPISRGTSPAHRQLLRN